VNEKARPVPPAVPAAEGCSHAGHGKLFWRESGAHLTECGEFTGGRPAGGLVRIAPSEKTGSPRDAKIPEVRRESVGCGTPIAGRSADPWASPSNQDRASILIEGPDRFDSEGPEMNETPNREPRLSVIEEKVAEIWKHVLKMPEEMQDATFFELNGESIAAVRMVTWIEEELKISVDVGDIFEEDPNLREFTRSVAAKAETASLP
jgi:peptidyl carrier protein